MEKLNRYSRLEFENMTGEAEKLQQEFPYSKSVMKETLDDLQIEEPYQECVLAKHESNKKIRKPKIKKIKSRNLEFELVKEDLKKVAKGVGKVITIPLQSFMAFPTLVRRSMQYMDKCSREGDCPDLVGGLIMGWVATIGASAISYTFLAETNPELVPSLVGVQIATNIGSGVYEYLRFVRKRARE